MVSPGAAMRSLDVTTSGGRRHGAGRHAAATAWVGAGRTWTPTSNKVGADMLLLLLGAVAGFWEVLLGDAHGLMPPTCTGSIGDGKLDDSALTSYRVGAGMLLLLAAAGRRSWIDSGDERGINWRRRAGRFRRRARDRLSVG